MEMKALSIRQPWAWLICAGYKDIENRDWFIGRKPALGGRFQDRGLELPQRIYVHAGKQPDKEGWDMLCRQEGDTRWADLLNSLTREEKLSDGSIAVHDPFAVLMEMEAEDLGLGAIIGEVDITGCVKKSDSPWFTGPYGFTLANPALYDKPIPYSGRPGFFEVQLPADKKDEAKLPLASSTENPPGYFMITSRRQAEDYALSIRKRLIEDALRRRDFRRAAGQWLNKLQPPPPPVQGRLI